MTTDAETADERQRPIQLKSTSSSKKRNQKAATKTNKLLAKDQEVPRRSNRVR